MKGTPLSDRQQMDDKFNICKGFIFTRIPRQ
jgi:hypothetical protein